MVVGEGGAAGMAEGGRLDSSQVTISGAPALLPPPHPHHTPTAPPVASPSILLSSQEPEQIERQGDYEDVSWSEAGERGAALQMRSRGS